MSEDIDPTLNSDEVVPVDVDPVEPADGSVIPPTEEPEEPAIEHNVPLSRLNEVIEERNSLRETTSALTRQVETLTTMVTKAQDGPITAKEQDKGKDALDELIEAGEISRDEYVKLSKILDAGGFARKSKEEDPEIKVLKETVKQLQNKQYLDQDAVELQTTLKRYEGIVDAPKIEAKMKEWNQSRDPELMRLAREGSYDDIVRKGFFNEIVQAEAAKLTSGKPPVAPRIDPSKQEPVKKPDVKEILYDPADPKAYDRAMRAAILAKIREKAE